MSALQHLVEEYLALRRSLGFKLKDDGRQLRRFAQLLADAGGRFITTKNALDWATRPAGIIAATAARRLGIVRTFAEFASAHDSRHEVPPGICLPYQTRRRAPYLYSDAEIQDLLRAADTLRTPAFVRSTIRTLVGLLAVTGMRTGEAIALDHGDLDAQGMITIRGAKFGKSRLVPLHPTAHAALRAYVRERDRAVRQPKAPAFFLSRNGTRLRRQNVSMRFSLMLRRAGLADRKPRRPRIHDLRHTFAVNTLCDWYRARADVEAQLPLLSTYLGHVSPSSTYWYLTATPELVGLAARRLERVMGRLP